MSKHTQRIAINVGTFTQDTDGELTLVSQRSVEVDAEVHGHWAAHKTLDGSPGAEVGWSVTHVPSGLRAHSGATKRSAIAAARALSKEMNVAEVNKVNVQITVDVISKVCTCDFCAARKHLNDRAAEREAIR